MEERNKPEEIKKTAEVMVKETSVNDSDQEKQVSSSE